tara:strand:+ start:3509 stop:4585 length:1077 start_codon:yes stop_codon:yes gene_type:complete
MKIPFFFNQREQTDFLSKNAQGLLEVIKSGKILQGSFSELLEARLAKHHAVKHCSVVGSGSDALFFAIESLKLAPGSKIAIPAFTFVATGMQVLRSKNIPVLVDVQKNGLISLEEVQSHKDVKAVVLVDLFGDQGFDPEIFDYCNRYKIKILIDGAQGFLRFPEYIRRQAEAITLSFDPTKILNSISSGGAVLTNSTSTKLLVTQMRYHGKVNGDYSGVGYNSQLSEISSFILVKKLETEIEHGRSRRLSNSQKIMECFCADVVGENFKNHSLHKLVFSTSERQKLVSYLKSKNIETRIHYEKHLGEYDAFRSFSDNPLPMSKHLTNTLITLPNSPSMSDPELHYICEVLSTWKEKNK